MLVNAFIRTANEYHGDARLLERYWHDTVNMAMFPAHEMDEFFQTMKNKNYPAVHHSMPYEKLYHPAYRVISLALCPEMRL